MVTLKNHEVYSGDPRRVAPVVAALNDILAQRVSRQVGKQLRLILRKINAEVEDISAEHKRLVELYSPKDDAGDAQPIEMLTDLTDPAAYQADYEELMSDTFSVEGIAEDLLEGMTLQAATWVNSIIVEDPPKDAGGERQQSAK